MSTQAIETEVVPPDAKSSETLAVARVESGAVSTRALSVDELKENLRFIREVMQSVMVEGQDYGKIPGCGDKPSLLQPGAQKLCMTFQLQNEVKKEVLREFPGMHREYELTITLVSATGRKWDGVGTCSTLESKYRYRKAERRCPECGKNYIIQGKAEYGGGWLCFKKKGGCGAKFVENDQRITSQAGGTVEYENPPDYWNTVRKMAFKRALVHASINATNTSELWTQDVEEMVENTPPRASAAPAPAASAPGGSKPAPERPAPPAAKQAPIHPTGDSRRKMIAELKAGPGGPNRDIVTEYFRKLFDPTPLMPNQEIEDLELRFVPATKKQMDALAARLTAFGNGDRAEWAFPPHWGPLEDPKPAPEAKPEPKEAKTPPPSVQKAKEKDPEWWRDVIVPIPRKGQKREEYLRSPDTIGSLYEARHDDEDARKRLWGFVEHYDPAPREFNGKVYQPTEADHTFRRALDEFAEFFQKKHPDEKL